MEILEFETPDGGGEAIKAAQGAPWEVSYPTGGFRFYGSTREVKAELRKRLRLDYPELPADSVFLARAAHADAAAAGQAD